MKDLSKYIINDNKSVRQALQAIDAVTRKILFAVDEGQKLVGTLSDGDIRRWILKSESLDAPIRLIINHNPVTMHEKNRQQSIAIMRKKGITAIPVVDENSRILDIFFLNEDKEIINQGLTNTKVIIMAGGKGERLKPYTHIVPKPLIPIGEKPIVEHVIDSFKKYGSREFFLTLNYKRNMIKAYFDELEKDYDLKFVEEDEPLGTGGGLYLVKDEIDSTFIVSNCDILLETDYCDVLKFHKEKNNMITIVTSLKKYTVPYGIVNIDYEGQIHSLVEKPSMDYLVNTGVYVIEPEVFEYINNKEFIHITGLIERCILGKKRAGTYPISSESWMDMGQFEDMEQMVERFKG